MRDGALQTAGELGQSEQDFRDVVGIGQARVADVGCGGVFSAVAAVCAMCARAAASSSSGAVIPAGPGVPGRCRR